MKSRLSPQCRCAAIVPLLFSREGFVDRLDLRSTTTLIEAAYRLACIVEHCPFPMIRKVALADLIHPAFNAIRKDVRQNVRRGAREQQEVKDRPAGLQIVRGGRE
jgi:hypothetical protein